MDCISSFTSEMSAAVPSAFCSWMCERERERESEEVFLLSDFFLLKLNFLKKIRGLLRNYAQR